jgi:hypothetical protein
MVGPMIQRQPNATSSNVGKTRLDAFQRHAFNCSLNGTNPANGLVADGSRSGAPASIAAPARAKELQFHARYQRPPAETGSVSTCG